MLKNIKENYQKNQEYYEIFNQNSDLPKAPTDLEKHIYGNGQFKLYGFVALLASGLALFGQLKWITESNDRWPFVFSIIVFGLFSLLTYGGAFFKRSFSVKKHKSLVKNFMQTKQTTYPTIDVYLPTCGEGLDILENAYQYVSKLQWFNAIKVYVLDDKNNPAVKQLAAKYSLNYVHRPNPGELKKAGNIRYIFPKTNGDYFVIFDADFCPRSDFLFDTIPYLESDKKIGILQTTLL